MPKTCKNIQQVQQRSSVQKTARKSTKYWKNKTTLKITHLANAIAHAKAIAFLKWSVSVKNYKCKKHAKNYSTRTAELFCAKRRSKKHQILEKSDNFENHPSCKGYSPCKGYSLCKMVSLGQKLKMPKACEKPFYKYSTVVLCKKWLDKAPIIEKKKTIFKIDHLPKAIAHAKPIAFAKLSVWVKN